MSSNPRVDIRTCSARERVDRPRVSDTCPPCPRARRARAWSLARATRAPSGGTGTAAPPWAPPAAGEGTREVGSMKTDRYCVSNSQYCEEDT